jgi:pimeloyl-ACP methyl ester carboxylesterase
VTFLEPDRAVFFDVNRVRLRAWEWGDVDAPAILCAHGAHDHGRMWDGFAPRLAALGYRIVAMDMRGHGDSARLASGHIWQASSIDYACVARALGPPVGMVGHSFGAGQLMWVAAVWPELARWVVSLDGLGPPPAAFEDRDLCAMAEAGLRAGERALSGRALVYASRAEMADRRARSNPRLPREWLEHLVLHGSREVEGGFVWKTDPMFNVGLPADFTLDRLIAEHGALDRPLLALTGSEHDTWSDHTEEEIADRLLAFRSVQHRVIDGAGHYVHIEQPDAVLAAVAEFLAEVGP